MIKTLSTYTKDFLHLFFPHNCEGCGSDIIQEDHLLCLQCQVKLPETNFLAVAANPIENIFYGRLSIHAAGSAYYFTKGSLIQQLVVELKYKNNHQVGLYLGKKLGFMLQQTDRFETVDYIIPLPLNPKKQQKRGYNQAEIICNGISRVWNRPVVNDAVVRNLFTETQTQKNRINRWQNMQEVFALHKTEQLNNKHVMLVDDIITTGATLEACGTELQKIPGIKLSIVTLAYTI